MSSRGRNPNHKKSRTNEQYTSQAIATVNNYSGNSKRVKKFTGANASGSFGEIVETFYNLFLSTETLGCKNYLEGNDPGYILPQAEIDALKPTRVAIEQMTIKKKRHDLELDKEKEYWEMDKICPSDWLSYGLSGTPMLSEIALLDPTKIEPSSTVVSTDEGDLPAKYTLKWYLEEEKRKVRQFNSDFPELTLTVLPHTTTPQPVPLSQKDRKDIMKKWILAELTKEFPHSLYATPPALGLSDQLEANNSFSKTLSYHNSQDDSNKSRAAVCTSLLWKWFGENVLELHQVDISLNRHPQVLVNIWDKYGGTSGTTVTHLTETLAAYEFTNTCSYEHFVSTIKQLFTQMNIAMMKDNLEGAFNIRTHTAIAKEISWDMTNAEIRAKGWWACNMYTQQQKFSAVLSILKKTGPKCNTSFQSVISEFEERPEYRDKQNFPNLMIVLDYQNQIHPQVGHQPKESNPHQKAETSNLTGKKRKHEPTEDEFLSGKFCRHCWGYGHLADVCWQLHPELQGQSKDKQTRSSLVNDRQVEKDKQSDPAHLFAANRNLKFKPEGCRPCYDSEVGTRRYNHATHGPNHKKNKRCGFDKATREERDKDRDSKKPKAEDIAKANNISSQSLNKSKRPLQKEKFRNRKGIDENSSDYDESDDESDVVEEITTTTCDAHQKIRDDIQSTLLRNARVEDYRETKREAMQHSANDIKETKRREAKVARDYQRYHKEGWAQIDIDAHLNPYEEFLSTRVDEKTAREKYGWNTDEEEIPKQPQHKKVYRNDYSQELALVEALENNTKMLSTESNDQMEVVPTPGGVMTSQPPRASSSLASLSLMDDDEDDDLTPEQRRINADNRRHLRNEANQQRKSHMASTQNPQVEELDDIPEEGKRPTTPGSTSSGL